MLDLGARNGSATDGFAPWVEWRRETCRRGRQLITAVNHRDGVALQLDLDELEHAMDSRSEVGETARMLTSGSFLSSGTNPTSASSGERPARDPGAGLIWRGANSFVRRSHDRALHHLFRRGWILGQIIAAAFGVMAITLVIARGGVHLHAEPGQIPATIALGLVAVTIHEFGHALVTVHYGRNVRTVGLRLHLGSPAFYVESVDALLLTRRQRIVQAAAGPWAEWIATSGALAVLSVLPGDSDAGSLLRRFVIINTIGIGINLLPFVGLDGALLFAEIVREPDLVWRAREALTTRSKVGRTDRWLVGYAVANAAVGAGLLTSAVFFWWQLFGELVTRLLSSGPPGVIIMTAAAAASSRHVISIARQVIMTGLRRLARLRSRIAFRMERRWRVQAVNAFRTLPELSKLDAAALGILAGRLQRARTCNRQLDSHGYIYAPAPRRALKSSGGTRTAILAKLDATCPDELVLHRYAVILPPQWRDHLVGSERSVTDDCSRVARVAQWA